MIVDLPAQSDRLVTAWIKEAGILELAAESGVGVVFWHVIDDGKDAVAHARSSCSGVMVAAPATASSRTWDAGATSRSSIDRRRAPRPNGWAPG